MTAVLAELEELEALIQRSLPDDARVMALSGDELPRGAKTLGRVRQAVDRVLAVFSAEIARQSTPELGHAGVAQSNGFGTPEKLVQAVTGTTIGEAKKLVELGRIVSAPAPGLPEALVSWDAPLGDGMRSGRLTLAQVDAIRLGLGSPRDGDDDRWRAALVELLAELQRRSYTVEELRRAAKRLRARLDVEAVEEERLTLYASRSFTRRKLATGMTEYTLVADPESAATIDSAIDTALSPRRNGPRFVDPTAAAWAADVEADPRTWEQHAFDVFLAIVTTGIAADEKKVFASALPEVHILVTASELRKAATGEAFGVAHLEGQPQPTTAAAVLRNICAGAFHALLFDESGRALDLGRSKRFFNGAQRKMLAARDGGCVFPGCTRPPSQCEAHHIVPWLEGGETSCDNGVLLCRFHHTFIHDRGWIAADGSGALWFHDKATGDRRRLRPQSGALDDLLRGGEPQEGDPLNRNAQPGDLLRVGART